MKTKICFAVAVAASVAAGNLRAQGTLTATATITEIGMVGSEYEYELALDNTGSNPINALWYGWTPGRFDLPSVPTSITGPSGWGASTVSDSVQFANNSGSAIAPGAIGMFAFESTSSPTALTSGTTDGDPTGESVAYGTVASMNEGQESVAGVASGPFTPTLATVPEPSTLVLMVTGLAGTSAWLTRRRSVA
jgi:hypothetical protein